MMHGKMPQTGRSADGLERRTSTEPWVHVVARPRTGLDRTALAAGPQAHPCSAHVFMPESMPPFKATSQLRIYKVATGKAYIYCYDHNAMERPSIRKKLMVDQGNLLGTGVRM